MAIIQQNPNSLDRYAPGPLGTGGTGALGGTGELGGAGQLGIPGPARNGAESGAGLFRVLWRQKILVIIPIVIFLGLAIAYLMTERKLYTARARLTVTPAGSRLSGESSDLNQTNFLSTQREKVLSREVLALALAQPIPDKPGKLIRDLPIFKQADATPLTVMADDTDVEVGKKDDVISVYFESPVPAESAMVANAVVDAYIKYQTQPRHTSTGDRLEPYKAEKKRIEDELAAITEKMSALEQKYGVLDDHNDDNLVFKQLNYLQTQLSTTHADLLKSKADYEDAVRALGKDPRLVNGSPDGIAGLSSIDDEQTLRSELLLLEQRLQEMRAHYLPEHPVMQAMQRKVDQIAAAYCQAVQRRYLRAAAAQADLQSQFDHQQQKAMEVSAKAAEYKRLRDDAERKRKLDETFDTRIHALELQQAAGTLDVDFWDRADAANAPKSHPSLKRALGSALALGVLLGCGLALLRDWMDDRLRSAEEIKSSLSMPLLGVVPAMPPGISPTISGQKVLLDPSGEVAEAYRTVRTNIYFGAPKDRSKTILVTSPSPGDGKTTCASNLAAVVAQAGKRVLLIDADLRSPSLHTIFSLKDTRVGLSGLLAGQGTLERAIQVTAIENLDILPCGPKPRNPSEMLNSPMFSELLEMLADKYDQIVIDSPPVMGLADARIIGANCDVTILVLRADRSTRKLAALARDGLAGVGAQILGAIVNDVSRGSDYNTGYGYGHRPRQMPADRAPAERTTALARTTEE